MEIQSNSLTLVSFLNLCYHCGISQEALVEYKGIVELQNKLLSFALYVFYAV